jgi:hypothetical protein
MSRFFQVSIAGLIVCVVGLTLLFIFSRKKDPVEEAREIIDFVDDRGRIHYKNKLKKVK